MLAIPLPLRVPNPPPMLVGRDREIAALAAAIARAPVAIAYGPPDIGKAAVALTALWRALPDAIDRAVYVDGAGAAMADAALVALAELAGHGGAGASAAERALALAEALAIVVVVDHARDPGWQLTELAARYARASRWIAITADSPDDRVLDHAIRIAPLPEAALAGLLAHWQIELPTGELALALARARGSPRRLRRLCADRLAGGPDALLAGDPRAAALADALALVEIPIPAGALAAFAPTGDEVAALREAGLLVEAPAGVALHPGARALVRTHRSDRLRALARPVATALADADLPALTAEAIRIALEVGDDASAGELLARSGEAAFAAAAPALARALVAARRPALARWRLRAAVELGDSDALLGLIADAAHLTDPADRVMWAEALMRGNRLDAAIEVVAAIDTPAALLVSARGLGTRGDVEAAFARLHQLAAHPERTPGIEIAADALAARLEALRGRAGAAHAAVAAVRGRVATVPAPARREVLQAIASTHHELGELAGAEAALDELEGELAGDPLDRFAGRRARLVRAVIAVERGDLARADALLGELGRASGFASLHRPFMALTAGELALARGDLPGVTAALDAVDPALRGAAYLGSWTSALASRARLVDANLGAGPPPPTAPGLWPAIARLHAARLAVRAGLAGGDVAAELALATDDTSPHLWFAARAVTWERALAAGDAPAALALALAAADRLAARGFRLLEAEAVHGAIDAAICARDPKRRDTAMDRLAALGRATGATRFERDLELGRVATGALDPPQLERIAAGPETAAVRRARGRLGDRRGLDAIDRAVLDALEPVPVATLYPTARWTPGWGVDRRGRAVWRPDGTIATLADKPQLWRLLEALLGAPEGASKEALVERAWGMAYRPLRHDKLLHNSIHKLRKLIEDPGVGDPRRIPTTSAGYRLGSDTPIRVVGHVLP